MWKRWVRRKSWINTDVCWVHREQVAGWTLPEKYSSGKCNLFITCVREKETKKKMCANTLKVFTGVYTVSAVFHLNSR